MSTLVQISQPFRPLDVFHDTNEPVAIGISAPGIRVTHNISLAVDCVFLSRHFRPAWLSLDAHNLSKTPNIYYAVVFVNDLAFELMFYQRHYRAAESHRRFIEFTPTATTRGLSRTTDARVVREPQSEPPRCASTLTSWIKGNWSGTLIIHAHPNRGS